MRGELEGRISVAIEELESLSRRPEHDVAVSKLVDFLKENTRLIVTFTGSFSSPARYLTLILRNLSRLEANFFNPQELTYYIAPYDEGRESSIIIFNSSDGLTSLNILLDQLRWTGHRLLLISASPLIKSIKHKVASDNLIVMGEEAYESWLLWSHLIVGKAVAKAIGGRGIRVERVISELSTLKPVIRDLVSQYLDHLIKLKEFMASPVILTASPTLWGVGEYLTFSRRIQGQRYLVRPEHVKSYVRFINKILLISTDVEEYSMKEIKGLSLITATKIEELRLKTDPLTAPIYGLILARIMEEL